MHSYTASTDFVIALASIAPEFGISASEVVSVTGLVEPALQAPGTRIPLARARLAWLSTAERAGEQAFGLAAAERLPVGALPLIDDLLQASRDWGEAATRLVRYAPLLVDAGKLSLRVCGPHVYISHRIARGVPIISELVLALIVLRARQFSQQPIRPVLARFMHESSDTRRYAALFESKVDFGAEQDQLVFSREVLALPFASHDPARAAHLEAQASTQLCALQQLAQSRQQGMTLEDVHVALRACLAEGNANLDRVAERLVVSPRSLQRYLSSCGTSHREILLAARGEVLAKCSQSGESTLTQLAEPLGYVSARSVTRALRRMSTT